MNTTETATFNQAVQLAQAGQKAEAYRQIKDLFRANPNDVNVLLWLAFTSPDLVEAERAIDKAARLELANPSVASARTWLANEKQVRPVSTFVTVPTSAPTVSQPTSSKKSFPIWFVFLPALAVIMGLLVYFVIIPFWIGFSQPLDREYILYNDAGSLTKTAKVGDLVSFTTDIIRPSGDGYVWPASFQGEGNVKMRFEGNLKPATNQATYFCKVIEQQGKDLLVRVDKIKP